MENNDILEILNNTELTQEEKTILLNELAESLKDKDSIYIVPKKRDELKEKKLKIEKEQKIYHEGLELDRITKEKLKKLRELNDSFINRELDLQEQLLEETKVLDGDTYEYDMTRKMEYISCINKYFKKYFREESNELEAKEQEIGKNIDNLVSNEDNLNKDNTEKRKVPKLKDNIDKITNGDVDNNDDNVIVKEEDGSRFKSKIKGFFKKHMKKVIGAGIVFGALGGLALAYYLLKQGDADSAHNVVQTITGAANDVVDKNTEVLNSVDTDIDTSSIDLSSKTDVGDVNVTYYTNEDAINGKGLTPNEWHQNNIMGAVDSDNNRYPAESMKDVYDLVDSGKDITSLEVGGYNPASGENEIDGHVTEVYGQNLQNIFDGRKM